MTLDVVMRLSYIVSACTMPLRLAFCQIIGVDLE
jgi:hypothetical protein